MWWCSLLTYMCKVILVVSKRPSYGWVDSLSRREKCYFTPLWWRQRRGKLNQFRLVYPSKWHKMYGKPENRNSFHEPTWKDFCWIIFHFRREDKFSFMHPLANKLSDKKVTQLLEWDKLPFIGCISATAFPTFQHYRKKVIFILIFWMYFNALQN